LIVVVDFTAAAPGYEKKKKKKHHLLWKKKFFCCCGYSIYYCYYLEFLQTELEVRLTIEAAFEEVGDRHAEVVAQSDVGGKVHSEYQVDFDCCNIYCYYEYFHQDCEVETLEQKNCEIVR
jgi:hypothetical protein